MKYIRLAVAAAVLGLLPAAPAQAALPKLVGTVGPGFTITLKKSGTKVTKLKAGKYAITVNDLSGIHNFHLTGPGVNKKTSVGGTGKTTWTVTLQKQDLPLRVRPARILDEGQFQDVLVDARAGGGRRPAAPAEGSSLAIARVHVASSSALNAVCTSDRSYSALYRSSATSCA